MKARTLAAAALAAVGGSAWGSTALAQEGGRSLALREEDGRGKVPPPEERYGHFRFGAHAFVEGGVSVFNFSGGDQAETAGTLRAGVTFSRLFAVETDFSQLFDESSYLVDTGAGGTGGVVALREPNRVSTAFARFDWPIGDALTAHARAGFARLDEEDAAGHDDASGGAAFGVGATLGFSRRVGLRTDYTRMMLDETDADVGTVTLAVRF